MTQLTDLLKIRRDKARVRASAARTQLKVLDQKRGALRLQLDLHEQTEAKLDRAYADLLSLAPET